MIQEGYGPRNTVEELFFTDTNEAVLCVKASDGSSPLMANLSNLSAWQADGTRASDNELWNWLRFDARQ